jgi:branched-chain amino acid transport system permease protein
VSILILEQILNGLQLGLMLFMLAAGLTLIFGIMDFVNLAHGTLYMVGGFMAVVFVSLTGSYFFALILAVLATAAVGALLDRLLLRRLYGHNHLRQVLATFGLILIFNDLFKFLFGPQTLMLEIPAAFAMPVQIWGDFHYSAYRLLVISAGVLTALLLGVLITRTRLGMWIRAGASDRDMARAMGVNIDRIFTVVFALGAGLCGLAGALLGPLLSVHVGMGESIVILAFVVVVSGGAGSVKGALLGALAIGMLDTMGRTLLPQAMRSLWPDLSVDAFAPALAAMLTYALMAAVLFWRPEGLFKTTS